MIKFSEWIKIKEQTAAPNMAGAAAGINTITGGKPDATISKFVSDIVGDKTGSPKNMKQKGLRISQMLRQQATQDAQRGDYSNAFKKAADAAKMTQVAATIK